MRKLKLILFKLKWKKLNKHNYTTVSKLFDTSLVKVGKKTYGSLEIHSYGNEEEKLEIGNFVSIASGVKFLLGGNHNYDTLSTYPFKVKVLGEKSESYTNGPIIVDDDVWIGTNSLILSGVKIGKGSIIAAGSIVTKDVPPYSIVGGNPAKVIKYRFDKVIIDKLEGIDLYKLNDDIIKENIDLFYNKIDNKNIDIILNKIKSSII